MDKPDPKAKYILHYSTDLSTPKGTGPSKMVSFPSWFRVAVYVWNNKEARDAMRAERCRLFAIKKKK